MKDGRSWWKTASLLFMPAPIHTPVSRDQLQPRSQVFIVRVAHGFPLDARLHDTD